MKDANSFEDGLETLQTENRPQITADSDEDLDEILELQEQKQPNLKYSGNEDDEEYDSVRAVGSMEVFRDTETINHISDEKLSTKAEIEPPKVATVSSLERDHGKRKSDETKPTLNRMRLAERDNDSVSGSEMSLPDIGGDYKRKDTLADGRKKAKKKKSNSDSASDREGLLLEKENDKVGRRMPKEVDLSDRDKNLTLQLNDRVELEKKLEQQLEEVKGNLRNLQKQVNDDSDTMSREGDQTESGTSRDSDSDCRQRVDSDVESPIIKQKKDENKSHEDKEFNTQKEDPSPEVKLSQRTTKVKHEKLKMQQDVTIHEEPEDGKQKAQDPNSLTPVRLAPLAAPKDAKMLPPLATPKDGKAQSKEKKSRKHINNISKSENKSQFTIDKEDKEENISITYQQEATHENVRKLLEQLEDAEAKIKQLERKAKEDYANKKHIQEQLEESSEQERQSRKENEDLERQLATIAEKERQAQIQTEEKKRTRKLLEEKLSQSAEREQNLQNKVDDLTESCSQLEEQLNESGNRESQLRKQVDDGDKLKAQMRQLMEDGIEREKLQHQKLTSEAERVNHLQWQIEDLSERERMLHKQLKTSTTREQLLQKLWEDNSERERMLQLQLVSQMASVAQPGRTFHLDKKDPKAEVDLKQQNDDGLERERQLQCQVDEMQKRVELAEDRERMSDEKVQQQEAELNEMHERHEKISALLGKENKQRIRHETNVDNWTERENPVAPPVYHGNTTSEADKNHWLAREKELQQQLIDANVREKRLSKQLRASVKREIWLQKEIDTINEKFSQGQPTRSSPENSDDLRKQLDTLTKEKSELETKLRGKYLPTF